MQSEENAKQNMNRSRPGATRYANSSDAEGSISVADYLIKPYIPYVWRYFLDFLQRESNADEFWTKPLPPTPQERKATVEIAAAHANTIIVFIVCDSGRYHHVEFAGRNRFTRFRFPQAE
mgnify:CR=1 FL=1